MRPTFIASVSGIVASVDEESRTSLNSPMKACMLHVSKGSNRFAKQAGDIPTVNKSDEETKLLFSSAEPKRPAMQGVEIYVCITIAISYF